jgi:hypothetical protein
LRLYIVYCGSTYSLDPAGNDYRFLVNRLVRSRNRVLHSIEVATQAMEEIAVSC